MLDIIWSPPAGMGKQVAPEHQRDRRFRRHGRAAARLETPFYFNELSEDVNEKICLPSPS